MITYLRRNLLTYHPQLFPSIQNPVRYLGNGHHPSSSAVSEERNQTHSTHQLPMQAYITTKEYALDVKSFMPTLACTNWEGRSRLYAVPFGGPLKRSGPLAQTIE